MFSSTTVPMNKGMTKRVVMEIAKAGLLGLCIYGAIDCYSVPKEYVALIRATPGGRMIYLTNLSLYLTILAVLVGYLVKFADARRLSCVYRDLLALSFSLEGVVTSMFWTLMSIDPTLVKNKKLHEEGIATSFVTEIAQHLAPLLLLSVDQVCVKLRKKRQCIYSIIGFSTLYFLAIWFFATKNDGKWVYPILNKVNMFPRILFVSLGTCIGICFYFCLLRLNRLTQAKEFQRNL